MAAFYIRVVYGEIGLGGATVTEVSFLGRLTPLAASFAGQDVVLSVAFGAEFYPFGCGVEVTGIGGAFQVWVLLWGGGGSLACVCFRADCIGGMEENV